MNVSCALLSSREGPRPISCTISTSWSRLQLQDMLTATCLLENSSGFCLDRGWALCIQVLRSSRALDLDSAVSAITYTIPVDQLGPGGQREVTLPLGPGPDTKTRQRCHKERKLQANITDEHRCKNPQQNTSKQNPTAH